MIEDCPRFYSCWLDSARQFDFSAPYIWIIAGIVVATALRNALNRKKDPTS